MFFFTLTKLNVEFLNKIYCAVLYILNTFYDMFMLLKVLQITQKFLIFDIKFFYRNLLYL